MVLQSVDYMSLCLLPPIIMEVVTPRNYSNAKYITRASRLECYLNMQSLHSAAPIIICAPVLNMGLWMWLYESCADVSITCDHHS